MTLRIHANDKTSYGGWFFLLRCEHGRQHAMTLEVHRDSNQARTFYVGTGFVFPELGGKPICTMIADKNMYVIEKPDILISMVDGSMPAEPDEAEPAEEPHLEVARIPLSLVA